MFLQSFGNIFFIIYCLFFLLDICSGLHFFDFVEVGILLVVCCVYFGSIYLNVIARSVWFSYYNLSGKIMVLNYLKLVSFSSDSLSYNSFYHIVLSSYHLFYNSFYYRYIHFSTFTYFGFFFSDGLDFLYSSYRLSSLWLFCVLMFCLFFVFSTFSPIFSSYTRFFVSSLKSHFLLEVNAFFSVVFYVIGLFFFCLLGLSVWFSLFYDSYGVVREIYGCQ